MIYTKVHNGAVGITVSATPDLVVLGLNFSERVVLTRADVVDVIRRLNIALQRAESPEHFGRKLQAALKTKDSQGKLC